uniref:LAGLIDADG homing endonuclease n=1 Tax=Cyathus jiayuguanensis TaxID=380660 RepID=UPI0023F32324
TLVSRIMVTLLLSIGLYAGKLEYFLGPLSELKQRLLGKIQTENEPSAGNSDLSYELLKLIGILPQTVLVQSQEQIPVLVQFSNSKQGEIPEQEPEADTAEQYKISDHLGKHRKPETDKEFGYYLAGLIEGDGNFDAQNLEIAFHADDTFLAYWIKKRIGYGSVITNKNKNKIYNKNSLKGTKTVRYVLKHSEGLQTVLKLVNGKFLTNKIIDQLLQHKYDLIFNVDILPKAKFDLLSNHWLTGFSDTQEYSCFIINLPNTQKAVTLEFHIKQKTNELLEFLKNAFGGSYYLCHTATESEQLYNYNSTNFKSAKLIIDYFDKYQLNSSKHVKYFQWRKAYRIIQRKEHFKLEGLAKIRKIQKNLRD